MYAPKSSCTFIRAFCMSFNIILEKTLSGVHNNFNTLKPEYFDRNEKSRFKKYCRKIPCRLTSREDP